ncbi:MAG: calcium-binding protein, partial [Henriciella sp.]|nr:calcium-binding protein [Henriciella sp.]
MPQKWEYAALSEAVYRRHEDDQAIDIFNDLEQVSEVPGLTPAALNTIGLKDDPSAPGYVYDPSNGFAAYVVEMDGKTVVAFRGTDSDYGSVGWENTFDIIDTFTSIGAASLGDTNIQNARLKVDGDYVVDGGDVVSNVQLGTGVYDKDLTEDGQVGTQWQSAKVLIDLLIEDLNIPATDIVVTGHSLGGGLAGLTAIKYNLENYLFGPAPFENQLEKEADQMAAEYILNLHADKFTDDFKAKDIGTQADALAHSWNEWLHEPLQMTNNVKFAHWGSIFSILSDFNTERDDILTQYENRKSELNITSVKGEFTTNDAGYTSSLGNTLDAFSEDFRPEATYNQNVDIGAETVDGKEAVSRHSPALNALIQKSQDDTLVSTPDVGSFDELLAGNTQLRHALLHGEGIAGANKNAKQGATDDMSATGQTATEDTASVELLYRTLWKSIGNDDGLYDYVEQVFSDLVVHGMAADGLNIDPTLKLEDGGAANLNRGITNLTLGVLRDAVQETSDIGQVIDKLGGTAEFVGALDAGYIHVPVHQITSTQEVHLDEVGGRNFGMRDVEVFAAEYIQQYPAFATWLEIDTDGLRDGSATLFDWGHLVVHAGADAAGLQVDLSSVPESAKGSLIIADLNASQDDAVITGSGEDWILLGEGAATVNAGSGDNVVIADSANSALTVNTGSGNDIILGGDGGNNIHAGAGANKIRTGSGNDVISSFGNNSEIYAGGGQDEIKAGGAFTLVYGGGGIDTVHVSSGAVLFADATAEDKTVFGRRELDGALGWGDASEKDSLFDASEGVIYSLNQEGELRIESASGKQNLFVAGYDDEEMTAGIRLRAVSWTAYQIMDPAYPGGEAYISGISDMMDEVYFALYGEERTATDPLILDLDGDGIELSGMSSISPFYDLDGDGFAERTGWTTGDDGFLAIDLNQDGQINDISELFGDRNTSGFDALGVHDSNADGIIDVNDAVFADLRIWQDIDSDGVTDAGELSTLTDRGIDSINLTPTNQTLVNMTGNEVAAEGSYTLSDGTTQSIFDVRLRTDELNTQYLGDTTVSAEAALLADAKGYGELPSLQIAATQDATVLAELQAAQTNLNTPVLSDLLTAVRPLTTAWSQYDDAPLSANMGVELDYSYTVEPDGSITVQDQVLSVTTSGTVEWYLQSDFIAGAPVAYATEAEAVQALHLAADAAGYSYASNHQPVEHYSYVIGEAGRVEITNMIWYDPPANSNDDPEWHLSGTGDSYDSFAAAQAGLAAAAAAEGGFVSTFSQEQLHVLERFSGEEVAFNELSEQDGAQRAIMIDYMEIAANLELQVAMTVSVQSGMSGFFSEVSYNSAEDVFVADTAADLTDTYQTILDAADDETDAAAYLAEWAPYLRLFLSQFDRGSDALKNSYSYQFANLVRGYETFATYPISIEAAADALGIPGVTLSAGTDQADIFYLSTTAGTFEGGAAPDNYVVGSNFANHIIDDRELVLQDVMGGDVIRFATHNSTDVSIDRVDNDLIITDNVTGNTITVVEQFLRARPSLTTGLVDDDRGVVEIIFADGVVWDEFDIAREAAETDASDQTIVGTRSTDLFDGGAGDDYYLGGNSADFYVFGAGDGNDVIYEYGPEQRADNDVFVLIDERDWVVFDDDIAFEDLTFDRSANLQDLIITHVPSGSSLTVKEQFTATNTGPFGVEWFNRVELFSFDSDSRLLTDEDVMELMLEGTVGDDTITGFYRQDTMTDTAGADYYSGGDDGDTYIFGRNGGSNTIEDGQTNVLTSTADKIVFSSDIDPSEVEISRVPNTNDLLITLSDGSTSILVKNQFAFVDTGPYGVQWFDRIETIEFESDPETIWTYEDVMARLLVEAKTAGDDLIEGYRREDTLDGGAGNDVLDGAELSDTYIYDVGYGHDTISETDWSLTNSTDRVQFGTGVSVDDITVTRSGDDLILTLAPSGETLTIVDQHLRFNSGAAPSQVEEFHFADGTIVTPDYWRAQTLIGTSADEEIIGYHYADTISGGGGTDRLVGGNDSDTYLFNLGDGNDSIFDHKLMISLGADDKVQFGVGLLVSDLTLGRSGDDLIFSFAGGDTLTVENQFAHEWLYVVEEFEFADGTIWTHQHVMDQLLVDAVTSGDDHIFGFDRDDILTGGAGNDRIEGKSGDDIYLFNLGDDQDTIYDHHLATLLSSDDTVQFGAGLLPSEVSIGRDGDDLIFTFTSGDSLTVENQFSHTWLYKVETFEFADGTVWTHEEVQNQLLTAGATPGDDHIFGFDADDILTGGAGNDRIEGKSGDDIYLFNLGDDHDTIYDHHLATLLSSDDTVQFGAGLDIQDVVVRKNGNDLTFSFPSGDSLTVEKLLAHHWLYVVENYQFSDGTVWTVDDAKAASLIATDGDDTIEGYSQVDDTLTGGLGSDTLKGLSGSDTYIYNVGDGELTIEDDVNVSTDTDILQINGGLTVSDLTIEKIIDKLLITLPDGSQIEVIDHFKDDAHWGIETIQFDDGSSLDKAGILNEVVFLMTPTHLGTSLDDTITGTSDRDVLVGLEGDDRLEGDVGSDFYVWSLGDGNDTIWDQRSGSDDGSVDQLKLQGIVPTDIVFEQALDDLYVTIVPSGEQIVIEDHFRTDYRWPGYRWGIEEFAFDDGTVLDGQALPLLITPTHAGTPGNDVLTGTSGEDILKGNGGDDLLYGGDGSDDYIFTRGDGIDEIEDNGNRDTDQLFIHGYAVSEVLVNASGDDLILTFAGTSDQITIWNTLEYSNGDQIEEIIF